MLYPVMFKPILKPVIWGGSSICPFKGISPVQSGIGESWEISHVEGDCSVVANGELEGEPLGFLIKQYGSALLGRHVWERFGDKFPLLVKFIDAREALSVQVHPDDELAKARHNSFGKTEMWYVVDAAEGAGLYSGFSRQVTPEEYVERVRNNTITDVLQRHEASAGDVFYLPAGRVHAIGAGCFIAEIQQTSDITYRIYDYNRTDKNGNTRELHTAQAKDAIDYTLYPDYKTHYKTRPNEAVKLVESPYFVANLLDLDAQISLDYNEADSFFIYICMNGEAAMIDDKGNELVIRRGATVLIPADTKSLTIVPSPKVRMLETFIP